MSSSVLDILRQMGGLSHNAALLDHYETKLLDNQPVLRDLITGIDPSSREAVERTITTVQTLALDYAKPQLAKDPGFGAGTRVIIPYVQPSMIHADIAGMIGAFAASLPEETLALTAGAVAHASKINFTKLGALTGSAAFAGLDFSNVQYGSGRHIEAIQTSYSGQVASALRGILNESEFTDETVKPLEALINSKLTSLPQNRVSAEGMFSLFTTLLAVVISYDTHRHYFMKDPFAPGLSHWHPIDFIVRGVLENTKRLIPQDDDNTYYRVMRHVGISARPKPRTYYLGVLIPDQTVRLVERSHKWVSVEYFDQIHGIARHGWAPKKYFQPLAAVAAQPVRETSPQTGAALGEQERKAITEDWEETNKRRIDLIYKKAENNLTSEEQVELDQLQYLADERIRMVAPLPLAALGSVLEKLERRT